MGPLALAAAIAVAAGALIAPVASGRRGVAAAAVVAVIGVRLMEAVPPAPLLAGFAAVSVVLVGYLLIVGGRDREPMDRWVTLGGAAFTVVGMVGGAAFAAADPLYPVPGLPLATAGGLFAAALVLLLRSDDPPAMACGAVLGLLGARLVLLHLGGTLSTVMELGLDLAMVGAAAAAVMATDPIPSSSVEPAPAIESAPAGEPAPAGGSAPAAEPAPAGEPAPAVESSPSAEAKPVRRRRARAVESAVPPVPPEPAPAVESSPSAEAKPVRRRRARAVEPDTSAVEPAPAGEPVPSADVKPVRRRRTRRVPRDDR